MKKLFKYIFTSRKEDVIEPSKVIKVGETLPFNKMADRQNPALYIHPSTQ